MRILVTGGTGMIGKVLIRSLLADGHEIIILSRSEHSSAVSSDDTHLSLVRWDGKIITACEDFSKGVNVVVNLAGENLSKWPWTKRRKELFLKSRVNAGKAISQAIASGLFQPQTLIQVSGVNYYGPRGEPIDELGLNGSDFLARLAEDWENSTKGVDRFGVRRCILRLGVVLSKNAGLFPLMGLPVRFFLGGSLGTGKQTIPWIHIDDVIGVIRFLIDNEDTNGVFNAVAPENTSNSEFYRKYAEVLKRPYWLRMPAFLLRIILGEMSVLVLGGRTVIPQHLTTAGYGFMFPDLKNAFGDLLRK